MENVNENQDLNREDGQENQQPKTYSEEEYNELAKKYSDTQEQLKASTKEAQKLHWISEVATDNTKFFKLYRSDKKQAEAVAKHFWKDAETLYKEIKNEYGEQDPWIDMDDIEAKAEEIADRKLAEKTVDSFKKEFGISWKFEIAWKEEFDNLMDWKKRTSEEVLKQAKRAIRLVKDTNEFQEQLQKANSRLAGAWITWSSKSENWWTKEKWPYEKRKEQEASNSIFAQYGKKKDF